MTEKEYIDLFHKAQINLVAFKPVFHCDAELRRMVEMAVEAEREACAKVCDSRAEQMEALYEANKQGMTGYAIAFNEGVSSSSRRNATAIRARGQQ